MALAFESVFFDIDGTLDDSNDAHARAWVDAFAQCGRALAVERVRPLIGMGGDKLLGALGVDARSDVGETLLARRRAIFLERYLPGVRAFPGARDLVMSVKRAGMRCVVASSASPQEREPLLAVAGVADLFDHAVDPDDVAASKPDADVVAAALAWTGTPPARALMVGDTAFDVDAAHRAGVRCIALRCGGSSDDDLAHADAIFDAPGDLAAALRTRSVASLLDAQRRRP